MTWYEEQMEKSHKHLSKGAHIHMNLAAIPNDQSGYNSFVRGLALYIQDPPATSLAGSFRQQRKERLMKTTETVTNEGIILVIAKVTHEANRAFCETIGDHSQLPWNDAPQWQRDSAINGIKFHMANIHAQPEDSHNSWMKQKIEEGWIWGETKDPETKTHPCMVPYNELPIEQQLKDYIFGAIAKTMIYKYTECGILQYEREHTPGEKAVAGGFRPSPNLKADMVKAMYAELWDFLDTTVPLGRHMSIAKTELEASCMWAIRATYNQVPA